MYAQSDFFPKHRFLEPFQNGYFCHLFFLSLLAMSSLSCFGRFKKNHFFLLWNPSAAFQVTLNITVCLCGNQQDVEDRREGMGSVMCMGQGFSDREETKLADSWLLDSHWDPLKYTAPCWCMAWSISIWCLVRFI